METAQHKFNRRMRQLNKQESHSQHILNNLRNKKDTQKVKRTRAAQQRKIMHIRKAKNKLKHNMPKQNLHRNKMSSLKHMKSDRNFDKSVGTIMPKNPQTDSSYVIIFLKSASNPTAPSLDSKPVEKGMNMTTISQKGTNTIPVEGVIGGRNKNLRKAKSQVAKLKHWSNNGTQLVYHSPQINSENCQISDFTPAYEMTDGGTGINTVNVSITLSETEYFSSNPKKKKGSKKHVGHKGAKKGSKSKHADGSGNKPHHYVVVKNGDTYLRLARSKHISLAHVKSLNKYSDRSIPVGAKIYY